MDPYEQILDDHVARHGNTWLDFTKVATGVLAFTGALVCQGLLVYLLVIEKIYNDKRPQGFLLWVCFTLFFVSVLYYTVITRFWSARVSRIHDMDLENEILRRRVEKKELEAKLHPPGK
jgi:hypothetical protein